MSIYVGNLSFDATQDQLTEVFAEYGTVSRVSMPTDRETGRPRGFAFVEMESEDQETAATTRWAPRLTGSGLVDLQIPTQPFCPIQGINGGGWNSRDRR
ncbi:MAG: RNA-binding protein [Leptolyngbyaceae cyanobacterium SM2_3_12]|nr:RNA-binding protein [Leptolyngbyaceae cyanobacterium SM2_3_12]